MIAFTEFPLLSLALVAITLTLLERSSTWIPSRHSILDTKSCMASKWRLLSSQTAFHFYSVLYPLDKVMPAFCA